MPSATAEATRNSNSTNDRSADRSTRLLLALWASKEAGLSKGKLTSRLKRKGEKSGDYQAVFSHLEGEDAIRIEGGKVAILNKGKELLSQHLKSPDLKIEGTIVGAWLAKALHEWIQQEELAVGSVTANGKSHINSISSYKEFEQAVLEVFGQLNQSYNMGNMVPIYRIRREIGSRVSRTQFNEWLLKMQSEDLLQLLEESVEDGAPDKIEDSVTTKLGKLRCYAKR